MRDPVTSGLAEFGFAELREAARLLTAYCDNPSRLSLGSDVRVCLNRDSGFVFLSDENYSVAMMNGDKLEMFYSCPECGQEGFAEELAEDGDSFCRAHLRDGGAIPQINDDEEAGE